MCVSRLFVLIGNFGDRYKSVEGCMVLPKNHIAFNGFFMLTIDQVRKIEPELECLSDEEVLDVLKDMYGLGQLAFEKWQKERFQKSQKGIAK